MKVLLFGATGLLGKHVLKQCVLDSKIDKILVISRKSTGVANEKVEEVLQPDFTDYSNLKSQLKDVDVCLYCLGISQNAVSKEEYIKITIDYLQSLIKDMEDCKPRCNFVYCSGEGADQSEKSWFLFGNTKGKAEKIVMAANFKDSYIIRPGFIAPSDEELPSRPWYEYISKFLFRYYPKQIGIDVSDLAASMIHIGLNGADKKLLSNSDLRNVAESLKKE